MSFVHLFYIYFNVYRNYEAKVNDLVDELGTQDQRAREWWLAGSPIPAITILLLYFTLVTMGPKFMRYRRAMSLQEVLVVYNIFQIALSLHIFKEVARACWWYYVSKYADLLDTMFFILRKKQNQMSFLHVYHHSTMIVNAYIALIYEPGGTSIFPNVMNTFIHAIMYSYYLLAAMGPKFQRFIWWKKYLTLLQLVQFLGVILQVTFNTYIGCPMSPHWLNAYVLTYDFSLIVLFADFYVRAYGKILRGNVRPMDFPAKTKTHSSQTVEAGVKGRMRLKNANTRTTTGFWLGESAPPGPGGDELLKIATKID